MVDMLIKLIDCVPRYEQIEGFAELLESVGKSIIDENYIDTPEGSIIYICVLQEGIFTLYYNSKCPDIFINFTYYNTINCDEILSSFAENLASYLDGILYSYELIKREK